MRRPQSLARRLPGSATCGGILAAVLVTGAVAFTEERKADPEMLRIGSSNSLSAGGDGAKEKAAIESLEGFIKEETGIKNDIIRAKDRRDLADRIDKGDFHLGVFQGYEFAWAREKYPRLKPLALAVNVHRYPVVHVVTQKTSKAGDLAALKGQSAFIPTNAPGYVRLFVEKQTGQKAEDFFSKLVQKDNVEDALDDVVDGQVNAAVLEGASLEAYKRRKPGRFNRLKEVAQSQPFPPAVVVYREGVLSEALLNRFREGLLNASRKERGQMMLTLFHLTTFEAVAADFEKVLAQTRKDYPPPAEK